MFDFLKKKISGFVEGLTKKKEPEPDEKPDSKIETKVAEPGIDKKTDGHAELEKAETHPKIEPKSEPVKTKAPKQEISVDAKKTEKPTSAKKEQIAKLEPAKKEQIEKPEPVKKQEPSLEISKPIETKPIEKKEHKPKIEEKIAIIEEKIEKKPKERVKLGIISAVKSIITNEVEIGESDVKQMLDEFELELLEADVEMGVAESIKNELTEKIVGAKIQKDKLHSFVSDSIKQILIDVLSNEKSFDLVEKMATSEKPMKIMLIGINGAGKTTTIAKVAKLFMDNKYKVVFAAADTFRAAAIEQMAVHADRLGVKVIKRDYGSDPTSVAYDAVNYAKAHGMDAVLIDTAGRQDTNISLINEVKKMSRVIQPDLKIYIGESIAGNAIIEQISTFNKEIGIDAVILTKLDCDPKGGTMLSINKATGIPIIYVGVGQKYEDLEKFVPEKIVENIVG
jgi:fused signal recognition particle receptor